MTAMSALIDATWPAASFTQAGGWTIREGAGGGSRVSAATWDGEGSPDLAQAEAAMRGLGQPPLVMVRTGEEALDAALDTAGYVIKDPTLFYKISAARISAAPPPVSSFATWPPLAIQTEIWQAGGIGPDRLAIMARARGAKTSLFGRIQDKPAGSAFIACFGDQACLHALEIDAAYRRQGLARIMMCHAALWAQENGADTLNLLVTRANVPANALYTSLGFEPVGHYHYRTLP